jgi:hypothetical protein
VSDLWRHQPVRRGDGWAVYSTPEGAWAKFTCKPDGETLAKLRRLASWDRDEKAWRAPLERLADLCSIVECAETWESVGDTPDQDGHWWGYDCKW